MGDGAFAIALWKKYSATAVKANDRFAPPTAAIQ